MTGASPSGGRAQGAHSAGAVPAPHAAPPSPSHLVHPTPGADGRDLWPREFGRDGVSGLVTLDRAMRARDVSRPDADDEHMAATVIEELLARVDGRRPAPRSRQRD